eukprot:4349520-Prymnesium_polylepis.2
MYELCEQAHQKSASGCSRLCVADGSRAGVTASLRASRSCSANRITSNPSTARCWTLPRSTTPL